MSDTASAKEEESEQLDQETFGQTDVDDTSEEKEQEHFHCNICSEKLCCPRVLSCLHVFCETCLDKQLIDETGDAKTKDKVIVCSYCQQETKMGTKSAGSLPLDYVTSNFLDMEAVESMTVLCTSCKSAEKAVSRCADCSNFLCPNCNTAHELMRCFENHHVHTLEDLRKSASKIPIHKPVVCNAHPAEHVKFFCLECQVAACSECMTEHKAADHAYERVKDADEKQREELNNLIQESKTRVLFCDDASNNLGNSLGELQQQHDLAKGLIEETFQSYKAVLEKQRDDSLLELAKLHSDRELEIMDLFHCVEKTTTRMEDACKFAQRLVEMGNAAELLTLKKVVCTQLLNLINNTPKPDVNVVLEFKTNMEKFEEAVKTHFGHLKSLTPPATNVGTPSLKGACTPPLSLGLNGMSTGTLAGMQLANSLGMAMSAPGGISLCNGGGASGSSRTDGSSPCSLKSSYDSDSHSSFSLAPASLNNDVTHPQGALTPSGLPLGFSSIQEYNLNQLATLAEKEDMEPAAECNTASPAFNLSNLSNLSDLFLGDFSSSNAMHNLQELVKLGQFGTQGWLDYMNRLFPSYDRLKEGSTNPTLNGNSTGSGFMMGGGATSPMMDNSNNTLNLNTALASLNASSYGLSTPTSPIMPSPDINGLHSSVHGFPHPRVTNSKLTSMQIRCKFGQLGPGKAQFNSPHGFCLGTEEDIIVADTNNHRIQVFEKNGTFKFQFGVSGKEEGQLWYPRKVAVIRPSGKFVVCDRGNERSRMQIFSKNGHFVKKIAIRYIDIVAGLAVTAQGHIVAVDSVSPTVFVISESGELLRWFDCSEFMREPSDIAINGKEYFVCDFKGHCVVVLSEEGAFLRRIGAENITNFPNGIDVSDAGDVLVGDSHGNRFHVAVFTRDGTMQSEFECPYVKVSRCCGLKITSEGYVVTLAKNNHHVLVLNTLYIL